ncbi:MAG TPA: RNA-binding S4 domain-containing protein, partial [Candidatus Tenderia electrophaga]|nr:RNA-binding S4 domain-containing protein [Candidatus Tenderia electrophaga]
MAKFKQDSDPAKVRLDKWLWAARFFKTRSLASEAINGGHVHLNGARVKPSRCLKVNDELRIQKGMVEFVVHVLVLSDRRGSATIAQTLYKETEASQSRREADGEQRRLLAKAAAGPV